MEIVNKHLSELTPYENNPRLNDDAVDGVAESIRQFGFKVPMVIDADGVIVCGHTRYKAAKQLGLEKVPCVVADDLTEDEIKAFRLADNKVAEKAEWDFNSLGKELGELEFDMELFGFQFDEMLLEEYGEEFSLPAGDKGEYEQITFTLHNEQAELIRYAMSIVEECKETFENTNKNGNAIYEVVRQWVEQKR